MSWPLCSSLWIVLSRLGVFDACERFRDHFASPCPVEVADPHVGGLTFCLHVITDDFLYFHDLVMQVGPAFVCYGGFEFCFELVQLLGRYF